MKRRNVIAMVLTLTGVISFTSCERDFFIDLDNGQQQIIVEAYINNELPEFNYVVLTHSQSYYDTGFTSIPVTGAIVTITEGEMQPDGSYIWDANSRKQLEETQVPNIPGNAVPGVY